MAKREFDILEHVSESFIAEKIAYLRNQVLTPTSHNFEDYGPIKIIEAAETSYKNYHNQAKKLPAISLIDVVLAANRNYNRVVLPNIKRLKKDYPGLVSFDDLNALISSTPKEEFYKIWGHNDEKKYTTLKNILNSITQLKCEGATLSDFEIMQNWGDSVDSKRYRDNKIGKIKNIGLATVQHLRMVFGANTVKPDQRVIEVLENEFNLKGISQIKSILAVEQISAITKLPALLLDQIFVLYGSGHYNRMSNPSRIDFSKRIILEIALKLKNFNIDPLIIAQSTNLSLEEICDL